MVQGVKDRNRISVSIFIIIIIIWNRLEYSYVLGLKNAFLFSSILLIIAKTALRNYSAAKLLSI